MVAAARERNEEPPGAFANAPQLTNSYQTFVITAFDELSTDRVLSFGAIGAIPWSAIDRYAERYCLTGDDIAYDDFVYHIRLLDDVWIKYRVEEQKREDKKREHDARIQRGNARSRPRR